VVGVIRLSVVLVLACVAMAAAVVGQQPYDVVIVNGRVFDGTGSPWYRADIGIRGDRVVAVGRLGEDRARRVIDATGLYVAPGFIDTHSHAPGALDDSTLSEGRPLLAQGVTTVMANPDGGGAVDLEAQRRRLLEHGLGVNVAQLVPHGSVRRAVTGMADRAPTAEELARMRGLVRRGMEAGAFGLSSGLYYAPGSYATTEEVIALAEVAAAYGGLYTSHTRDESDYTIGVVASVEEVIRIAREAGLPGVVTHIKVAGPSVWGFSSALVTRIDRARAEGVEVWADQYPYTASATSLTGVLAPRWALAGGDSAFARRLATPADRTRIRADVAENLARRGGAATLQFRYAPDTTMEGRTLADVAAARGTDPVELALALFEEDGVGIVSFSMDERDVLTLMRQPWTMTASDGDLVPFGRGVPHPRSYGTFPRKIRRYAIELGVMDVGRAIHTMTGLPATVYRIRDRGSIQEGAFADLVVFDLARLTDRATFTVPHQLSEGMLYVFVNGVPAIADGQFTGALTGRVLRRET
jgi:N-acyl-D-amino-acid deacylase